MLAGGVVSLLSVSLLYSDFGDRQGVERSLHDSANAAVPPASANGGKAMGVHVGQRIFPPDFGDSQAGNAAPAYLFNSIMKKANRMGTFVEFGCADGTTHSTTHAYELMGWKGLCIEPNYPNYLKAKKARKNAIFALVTGKPGKFTYAQMEGPECNQASGIIEFYSPAYMEILRKCEAMGKVERVPLDGTPLETLLERYGFTQVDWISVDCEGCEPSFISGFDFTKWGVQVVNYEPNTAARMHTDWIEAGFAKHGFKFDRELQDRIWRKPGAFKLEGEVLSNWGGGQGGDCRLCNCAPLPGV